MRSCILVVIGLAVSVLAVGCDEKRVLLDSLPILQYQCDEPEEPIKGLGPCVKVKPLWRTVIPGKAFWVTVSVQNTTTAHWRDVVARWRSPGGLYWASAFVLVNGAEQRITSSGEVVVLLGDMPSRAKRKVLARFRVGTKPPAAPRATLASIDGVGIGTVPLAGGWNLIAVPYRCSAKHLYIERGGELKHLQEAAMAEWIAASIWGWDTARQRYTGVWEDTDALAPLRGYWILAADGCRLLVLNEPPPPPEFE